MIRSRLGVLPLLCLTASTWFSATAQSVISTHSGLLYFFDGTVYIGDQKLEQKFGRFPEVGEGSELRSEKGRAEVLLTPGTFFRIGENSSLRMVSNRLSDTQVELLSGSGIVEATDGNSAPAVQVIYKDWRVRLAHEGVYRLDSEPAQVTVFKGEVEVGTQESGSAVTVKQGQTMPLAPVLVPESSTATNDALKTWAMNRSQVVSSDNATAAGIIDDPDAIDQAAGSLAGFSYFPLTGIPGIATTNPYGVSFWSPFQATMSSIYFPAYSYTYLYASGWPSTIRYPLGLGRSFGTIGPGTLGRLPLGGVAPGGGYLPYRPVYTPTRLPSMPPPSVVSRPRPVAPPPAHVGARPVGHR
jgi:hypothetical protein